MRRFLLIGWFVLSASAALGQQVRSGEAGFEEFRMLLGRAGYEAWVFDLREFLPDRYEIAVRVKEYVAGRDQGRDAVFHLGVNKMQLSDLPEESRAGIRPEQLVDSVAGTVCQAEQLTVGLYPSGTDSLAAVVFDLPTMGAGRHLLRLRGLTIPGLEGRTFYYYRMRPFRLEEKSAAGRFVPLLFYGSAWYDERSGLMRFCGERILEPDLSSELVGNVPHFFVIGLELTPSQE